MRYRGLESFRTSQWDPKENLPEDFSRIFQFENYDRTRRRVFKELEDSLENMVRVTGSLLAFWFVIVANQRGEGVQRALRRTCYVLKHAGNITLGRRQCR